MAILGTEAGIAVPETCLKLRYVFAEKHISMLHRWQVDSNKSSVETLCPTELLKCFLDRNRSPGRYVLTHRLPVYCQLWWRFSRLG